MRQLGQTAVPNPKKEPNKNKNGSRPVFNDHPLEQVDFSDLAATDFENGKSYCDLREHNFMPEPYPNGRLISVRAEGSEIQKSNGQY